MGPVLKSGQHSANCPKRVIGRKRRINCDSSHSGCPKTSTAGDTDKRPNQQPGCRPKTSSVHKCEKKGKGEWPNRQGPNIRNRSCTLWSWRFSKTESQAWIVFFYLAELTASHALRDGLHIKGPHSSSSFDSKRENTSSLANKGYLKPSASPPCEFFSFGLKLNPARLGRKKPSSTCLHR